MNDLEENTFPEASNSHSSDSNKTPISDSSVRVNSVARVFKMIGWLGTLIYTPMVLTCMASMFAVLFGFQNHLGNPKIPAPFLALATVINGVILTLFIFYIKTGRSISERDYSVQQRARLMSMFMMIGFPLFTVIGYICLRNLNRDFIDLQS